MLEKRSLSLSGHRTSIALEPEFWAALEKIAERSGLLVVNLIMQVDAERTPGQALASGLRIFVLQQQSQ